MKNIMIAILAVLCFLLYIRGCEKNREESRATDSVVDAKRDTGRHYIDDAGRVHLEKKVAEGDNRTLKLAYTHTIDSLLDILHIKESQLKGIVLASSSTVGTAKIKVDTVYVDSSRKQYNLSYSDKWLSLTGSIGTRNYIDYQVYDSLAFTIYQRKTGLFGLGRKVTYIDGFSLNPKSVVTGITAMQVPVKQPGRFSIGPYVGYGYIGSRWEPSAGISLQYSIIRF